MKINCFDVHQVNQVLWSSQVVRILLIHTTDLMFLTTVKADILIDLIYFTLHKLYNYVLPMQKVCDITNNTECGKIMARFSKIYFYYLVLTTLIAT